MKLHDGYMEVYHTLYFCDYLNFSVIKKRKEKTPPLATIKRKDYRGVRTNVRRPNFATDQMKKEVALN